MKMRKNTNKLGNQFGIQLSPLVASMRNAQKTCCAHFRRKRNREFENPGIMFESMEPRVLLSADLGLGTAVLTNGITQLDDAISDFFSDSLLNTPLPLLIESEAVGDTIVSSSPGIADLLAIDITNIGTQITAVQDLWNGFDANNNGKVTLEEFFTGITDEFGSKIGGSTDADALAVSLSDDFDQSFTIATSKGDVDVNLDINVVNESDDNKLAFDTDITFSTSIDLAIDLGAQAELADFSLDGEVKLTAESIFNFDFDFGVFTSGETPFDDDFFVNVEAMSASLNTGIDPFNVDVQFGFLAASIVDGSLSFNAGVDVSVTSLSDLSVLGFATTQVNADGSLVAGTAPADFILAKDVQFHLRIGDSDAKTVTLLASETETNASLTDLANDLQSAVNAAGLSGLIEVTEVDSKLTLSTVAGDAAAMGFSSGDIGLDAVVLTANVEPTLDGTSFDFLISVNNALPVVVNVIGATNITALVNNTNTALTNKGINSIEASVNVDKIKLTSTAKVQISNVLTIDSLAHALDIGAANDLVFSGGVNDHLYELDATLPVSVNAGLGFNPEGLALSINVDDSTMSQDGDRFDFDIGINTGAFDDLLNFQELSPAKIISLLGQLADFMGGFTDSDIISGVVIPFANADLGDVLDYADVISDTLIFDDFDDNDDLTFATKLLDENSAVTFGTAQELAVQFADILGINLADIGANYNAVTDELTYTLNLSETFTAFDVDVNFDFDLDPLAEFVSDSNVSLSGEAGLSLTLGITLGDVAGSTSLENTTVLSDLRTRVEVKQDHAITAENNAQGTNGDGELITGLLTADATFDVQIGSDVTSVTVLESLASDNRNILDLVRDVNNALETSGLSDSINASSIGQKLVFTEAQDPSVDAFIITATNANATDELGLAGSATANLDDLIITLSDGTELSVSLNSATDIGGVLAAIGGASADLDIVINDDATALILTDNAGDVEVFSVVTTNGSLAGIQLGIVGFNDGSDDSTDELIIQGASIAGATLADRFFVENAEASGSVSLGTLTSDLNAEGGSVDDKNVDVTARFGFVDIGLSGEGSAEVIIAAGLKAIGDDVAGGRITLTDLVDNLITDPVDNLSNITNIVAAPDITGSASLELALKVSPDFSDIDLAGSAPSISFGLIDFGDPLAGTLPNISVTLNDLDNLAKFDNIGFSQILDGLIALGDFLGEFESFGFLNEDIPLINLSVNDLLSFADRFDAAVQSAQDNPAATLQSLEQVLGDALGIADDDLDAINLSLDGDVLKFELGLGAEFSEALGVDFDLSSYIADLTLDPAIAELLSAVNLAGSAGLVANGDIGFDLDFGIDLGFDGDNALGDLYIYDTTGLGGSLLVAGQNLSFRGAIGPVGLFVNNYTDEDGVLTEAEIAIDGSFSAGLDLGADDKVLLDLADISQFISDNTTTSLTGTASATLPVFLPTDDNFAGILGLSADLTDLANVDVTGLGDILSNFDPANLSLFDNMLLAVDGIDFVLEGLQDLLDGALGEISLPLIGDGLADGAGFIEDFRESVVDPFRTAVENLKDPNVDIITELLEYAFGDVLKEGTVVLSDTNINDPGVALNDTFMQWNLVLGETTMLDAGIGFDIGLPGLGIETEGEIDVELGWEFAFGFGLSVAEGFYFDISDGSELELNVDVLTPGAAITGQLGFLGLTAEDKTSREGESTHLGATFAMDIVNKANESDGRLGFAELGQLGLNTGIAAEAIASLGLDLKVEGVDIFPELSADFYLDWSLGDRDADEFIQLGDLSSSLISEGLNLVEFRDVTLDLGSYINDFIGPVLDTINDVLEPIQPIIDFLTAPLPVISDLGADLTLLDIAAAFGNVDTSFINSLADILELIELINDFDASAEAGINFGDFAVFDATAVGDAALNIDLSNARADLASLKDKVVDEATTKALPDTNTSAGAKLIGGDGFDFPILTDPSQIFGLLLGNTADLVTYDFGTLALDFSYSQFFPIFGPLGASITGQIGALIDFDFGFDTKGIEQFAQGGFTNPELIFNGFYIDDLDDNGVDVPEVVVTGGLSAAAELNLGIARGGVAGGVFVEVLFDLFDPDRDGKVRIQEILGNIENEIRFGDPIVSPLAIFDISGEIFARLFAFVKVDLFFFSIDFEEDIVPPFTILDFGTDFFRPPSLATELDNGDLQINMGNFSELRLNGDLRDLDERVFVKQDGVSGVKIWAPDFGISEANAEHYDVSGTIIVQAGEGNDVIDMSAVTGNYTYNVEGGAGNDIIKLGSGTEDGSIVEGGLGNDRIWGSNGNDTLIGSVGDDEIHGNGGDDWIFGDAVKIRDNDIRVRASVSDGKDRLFGDGGNDLIIGGAGDDEIEGGIGNDILIGDAALLGISGLTVNSVDDTDRGLYFGADMIDGGDNDDTIYGGKGDDNLSGGNHDDTIYGESGFDEISGNSGADELYGGDDNDLIEGGTGDDVIFGEAGADVIHGDSDNDTIDGGRGADILYGDSGEDNILGGSDPDRIYGGDDNDVIDGEQGADTIYGNAGDDDISSSLGNDFIDGNAGADEFFVYYAGSDTDKRVEVFDSGAAGEGADELTVFGTEEVNEFLLRAGTSEDAIGFVALLNTDGTLERTDYHNLESLVVEAGDGDDNFAIDDNRAITRIEGGAGNDTFQIGQMYNSQRTQEDANIAEVGDQFGTIETTIGFLSNGISLPMTINGGSGDDIFTVFHNKAVLTLNGDDGNDTFSVRAFALAGSQDNTRDRTDISGGSDADLIQYAVNAPVGIDGGDGKDTVIVIGTEFGDDFVITADGVFGGGLNVSYANIELLTVNGAEGDDRFFVQSTSPGVSTTIQGGLGSDSFNIAGDTPPIISNDLLGHSGIISHTVTSDDPLYDGIKAEGVSVNIADNDEPGVVITPIFTSGDHVIEGELTGAYTVVLTRAPRSGEEVVITAIAPQPGQEAFDNGERLLQFISDGAGSNVVVAADGNSVQITFDSTNWNTATQVSYEAINDGVDEGTHTATINHTVSANDTISGTATSSTNLVTNLVDADAAFITAESGLFGGVVEIISGTGVGQQRGIIGNTTDELSLAFAWNIVPDATSVYIILLNDEVIASGDVDSANNRVILTDITADFDSEADTGIEGGALRGATLVITEGTGAGQSALIMSNTDTELVLNKVWSTAPDDTSKYEIKRYNGLAIPSVDVRIDEGGPLDLPFPENPAPTPGVQITHSNGATSVIEGYDLGDGVPFTDTYEVVLTSQPTADVTVLITVEKTKTTVGNIFHNEEQVVTDVIELVFTSDNWNITQTVAVAAIDDNFVDGMDTKVFADIPRVINKIQGPLFIEGEGGDGSGFLFDPLMLPGETNIKASLGFVKEATANTLTVVDPSKIPEEFGSDLTNFTLEITEGTGEGQKRLITLSNTTSGLLSIDEAWDVVPDETSKYTITRTNPNFLVDEAEQVDILTVFNNDSRSDDSGVITATNISGFGMGGDAVIDGETIPGGITYGDLENLTVNLGFGNDTVEVLGTHTRDDGFNTVTILNAGGGDDDIFVSLGAETDGFFAVKGEAGNDTIDASASSLGMVIFGDEGDDHLIGGSGNDIIFGDLGRIDYLSDTGEVITRLGLAHDFDKMPEVVTADDETPANQTDGIARNPSLLLSRDTATGGTDTIESNGGNDIVIGGAAGDTVYAGAGNDLVFGDHAELSGDITGAALPNQNREFLFTSIDTQLDIQNAADTLYGDAGDDIILGQQGADTIYGGDDDDDIIGGHNVTGGSDTGDSLDGGLGNDVIAGDNAIIDRRDDVSSLRMQTIDGTKLYDGDTVNVSHTRSDNPDGTAGRDITILDHADTTSDDLYGDDYIAGGGDDDLIFGQLGDDIIQGDGSIDLQVNASVTVDGMHVSASVEAETDGDDYIEGNGGSDVVFGNLGQDDIIGGSSNLYGLVLPEDRPDGEDILFGGAGTDLARNNAGDESTEGHARDADVILGDNGIIYRLIDESTGSYLEFNYDDYSDLLSIIPRAAIFLDYTPGGAEYDVAALSDIGAADEIHGESGDDQIYGMKGADVLYGEGQDDDLIGGYGHDWISGGAGQDGVLGDDGRIFTKRFGSGGESVYGIAGLADSELDQVISTPGNLNQATINVTGELNKIVDLTPFNVDPNSDPNYDALDADDIIYGGIGSDFLHGGSGDDAISGAEAQDNFYNNPVNEGDVLEFGLNDPEEFAAYDENNPRKLIDGFLLNFDASEGAVIDASTNSDGNDVIFGDLGNDWLVGGTGNDHLYGGWGNDLLNADDDLSTNGGLNDQADTHASYNDIAFGGAGRDVLIANTGGDRLIDWLGEFDSFIVPFGPFGEATISRAVMPQMMDYLYMLSAADGADQTLGSGDGTRNGEPDGELGLVTPEDDAWQTQTGAPGDPQPGNGGSTRDVTDSTVAGNTVETMLLADALLVEEETQKGNKPANVQLASVDTDGPQADVVYVFDEFTGEMVAINQQAGVIGDIAEADFVDYTNQTALLASNGNAQGFIKVNAKGHAGNIDWSARA